MDIHVTCGERRASLRAIDRAAPFGIKRPVKSIFLAKTAAKVVVGYNCGLVSRTSADS